MNDKLASAGTDSRELVPWQKVEMNAIGLRVKAPLSWDEWEGSGKFFNFLENAIGWVVGDWLNYGENKFGEKYAQAMEGDVRSYQTLRNYAHVAGRVPYEVRRPELSFSHHAEVAVLEPAQQVDMLTQAVENQWTVREIRKAVSDLRKAEGKKTTPTQAFTEFVEVFERHGIPTPELPNDRCVPMVAKVIRDLEQRVLPEGHVAVSENSLDMVIQGCGVNRRVFESVKCSRCELSDRCKELFTTDEEEQV